MSALRKIPSSGAAWSWGEFHNGGLQPLYTLSDTKDWQRWALYAVDLGVAEKVPPIRDGETTLTPLEGLSRNLISATEPAAKGPRTPRGGRRLALRPPTSQSAHLTNRRRISVTSRALTPPPRR
jgi:hypothetical protein